ncbi:hypothetical protein DPMN_011930 [Dreissena polymorpha]|uniref:Uncharacterized protein n=1 Tax=Dreissena polymorpha TaxID=45954 RepID=A0A9D4S2C8_DREPO|nr:hypothetical protein DPMN_011930 [Dreissena polymorpha]
MSSVTVTTAINQNVVPTTLPYFADASSAYTDSEQLPVTLPCTSVLPTNSTIKEGTGIGSKEIRKALLGNENVTLIPQVSFQRKKCPLFPVVRPLKPWFQRD